MDFELEHIILTALFWTFFLLHCMDLVEIRDGYFYVCSLTTLFVKNTCVDDIFSLPEGDKCLPPANLYMFRP